MNTIVISPTYNEKNNISEFIKKIFKLNHPNLVRVFDLNKFYKNDKVFNYITMSYVSGESLSQLVSRKIRLDIPVATSIMIDLLKGLASAHKNNPTIIHRDIKPENILIVADNGGGRHSHAKICDFVF